MDDRVRQAILLRAAEAGEPDTARAEAEKEIREKIEDLRNIVDKCSQFKAVETWAIEQDIQKINDEIWDIRMVYAWRKAFPNSKSRF
jgi:hypothetical protein